ncbi:MAG: DsbE family thiol:disulfide interchange protein [Pseudomonadales bacterium]|nr:DsbE family thiol:disulfide interchange protein [Pseudomonadales bacterium]MDP6471971.1 DsbE family thiol:disulfide interchange protein [Pseudomonadales bacterium]MDP6826758.1 DsbE family thiol:disulfide interchange protein [Pseudomonadales bacterium]MDP6971011.1 DsbE family thiol:disulfide interchange protein [Pseudomonadales bacterium]
MNRVGLYVPLALFAVILVIGYAGFQLADPHQLPSALIGKPFPEFTAERLDGGGKVVRADLIGEPLLINVWATWCPACKAEHDELMAIRQRSELNIVGVNYKDDPAKARRWLDEYGDPYEYNLLDPDGMLGVELGVYGAPETFLLNEQGIIVYKRIGEVTERIWRDEILPHLKRWEVAAQ